MAGGSSCHNDSKEADFSFGRWQSNVHRMLYGQLGFIGMRILEKIFSRRLLWVIVISILICPIQVSLGENLLQRRANIITPENDCQDSVAQNCSKKLSAGSNQSAPVPEDQTGINENSHRTVLNEIPSSDSAPSGFSDKNKFDVKNEGGKENPSVDQNNKSITVNTSSLDHNAYQQTPAGLDNPTKTEGASVQVQPPEKIPVNHKAVEFESGVLKQNNSYKINTANIIQVTQGVNEIIPISQGYVNRIVTPFAHPEVISSSIASSADPASCETFCIRGKVIYITTNDNHPIGLFITEEGSSTYSISLTLIPKHIPPREIVFELSQSDNPATFNSSRQKAREFERSTDYVSTLKNLLKALALNQIPQGYELHTTAANQQVPQCRQQGLSFSFKNPGQYLLGFNFAVYIGVVTNNSSRQLEFMEEACGSADVAAVAAWPQIFLAPGEHSELFVVKKLYAPQMESQSFRPNLLRATGR